MDKDVALVPLERIERSILFIRGQRVLLSTYLAELYQVEPRALVQAVRRNIARFPQDFMFQLTAEEFSNLKSQIVISSRGGLRRARPYAFTGSGQVGGPAYVNPLRPWLRRSRGFARLREAPPAKALCGGQALRQRQGGQARFDEPVARQGFRNSNLR